MDEVYYVGSDVDGQHVGLDPNGNAIGLVQDPPVDLTDLRSTA
jgi:hypothetical protein